MLCTNDIQVDALARRVVKSAKKTSGSRQIRIEHAVLSHLGAHPHVVELLQYVDIPGSTPVLTVAYGGIDLLEALPTLTGNDVLCQHILAQVGTGLAFLHSRRVAHLDVKPDNVVVDACCHVRLIDFGLSVMNTMHIRYCAGTPSYLSPELWAYSDADYYCRPPPPAVDVYKSDLWSFGILAYGIFHAVLPWHRANSKDVSYERFRKAQVDGGASPSESLASLAHPVWLRRYADALLAIDPAKRCLLAWLPALRSEEERSTAAVATPPAIAAA